MTVFPLTNSTSTVLSENAVIELNDAPFSYHRSTKSGEVDEKDRHKKNGIAKFDTRRALVEYNGKGYAQSISIAQIDPSLANEGKKKRALEELVENGVSRVIYAKKAVHENKTFDKKLKNQSAKGTPATANVSGTNTAGIHNNVAIASSSDSNTNSVPPANADVNGTDKSLDLPTDTEIEDRGWDLPEALEEQLIAELESSYARVMERKSMSIKITRDQKEYIGKYVDNLDEILKEDEINEVLFAVDDAIISTFDKDGYPDEVGNKLQRIYDELYLTNCEW